MYNCTGQRWLESTYVVVGEGKVFFSTITKPGMFGLDMAPKEKQNIKTKHTKTKHEAKT